MKKTLFLVSLAFFAFATSAFGKGSPRRETVSVFKGLEIKGPYVVEVNYALPLATLIGGVAGDGYLLKDDAVIAQGSGKQSSVGSVKREIYIVRSKVEIVGADSLKTYRELNQGAVLESDFVIAQTLKKDAPDLHPAGPYELFSFAAQHGAPLNGVYTPYGVLGRPTTWKSSLAEEKQSRPWFSVRYDKDGGISVIAASTDFPEKIDSLGYVLFMK